MVMVLPSEVMVMVTSSKLHGVTLCANGMLPSMVMVILPHMVMIMMLSSVVIIMMLPPVLMI